MSHRTVACLHLALALALSACSAPETGEDAPSVPRPDSRVATAVTDDAAEATADSIVLTLSVEGREPGDRVVRASLRAQNTSGRPIVLYLRGREPTVDLAIGRPGEGEVVRRLADAVIPAIIQARTLDPNESFTEKVEWRVPESTWGKLSAGEYTLRAYLFTEGTPFVSPVVGLRVR